MSIFIKKLHIKNYKCFKNESLEFNLPDGTPGSGLNILIGENANGKTTILEAVDFLTSGSFSAGKRLSIGDFQDFKREIVIQAETTEFACGSSIDFYKGWRFKSTGVVFSAKNRGKKASGQLLSSPFEVSNRFITEDFYTKKDGSVGSLVDGRDKTFSKARIADRDELNIFYFDKNRTRQIASGTFTTTFERICDDLNWNFIKNLDEENLNSLLNSIVGDYFSQVDKITNKHVGVKSIGELQKFFQNDQLKNLRIELLNLLHPFSASFFALRNEKELTQIMTRDLGSGIEMILTLLMLKNIAGASKGSIMYLIDEPELHLHPKAQDQLMQLLVKESESKQIILSTHSPYLFRGSISEGAKLLIFTRNAKNNIAIDDARKKGWGLFPWSPSWGEVNFFAYDMPTLEFHDELYGFLHERYISASLNQQTANTRSRQTEFEKSYLQGKLSTKKSWTPEFGGQPKTTEPVTLPTFIRNKSHHPENRTMSSTAYSDIELKESIEELIYVLRNP